MKKYNPETCIKSKYFERPTSTHSIPEESTHREIAAQQGTIALKEEMYRKASVRKRTYKVKVADSQE